MLLEPGRSIWYQTRMKWRPGSGPARMCSRPSCERTRHAMPKCKSVAWRIYWFTGGTSLARCTTAKNVCRMAEESSAIPLRRLYGKGKVRPACIMWLKFSKSVSAPEEPACRAEPVLDSRIKIAEWSWADAIWTSVISDRMELVGHKPSRRRPRPLGHPTFTWGTAYLSHWIIKAWFSIMSTPKTPKSRNCKPTTEDRKRALRHLRELIAAIDRRVPQIERDGEITIARDAAALRRKAVQRTEELERED